jgi:hypothetical protein
MKVEVACGDRLRARTKSLMSRSNPGKTLALAWDVEAPTRFSASEMIEVAGALMAAGRR